jgi:hypothetical protein
VVNRTGVLRGKAGEPMAAGFPYRPARWQAAERPHGLAIVRSVASEAGIDGNVLTGWIVWARLDWPPVVSLATGDPSETQSQ